MDSSLGRRPDGPKVHPGATTVQRARGRHLPKRQQLARRHAEWDDVGAFLDHELADHLEARAESRERNRAFHQLTLGSLGGGEAESEERGT